MTWDNSLNKDIDYEGLIYVLLTDSVNDGDPPNVKYSLENTQYGLK